MFVLFKGRRGREEALPRGSLGLGEASALQFVAVQGTLPFVANNYPVYLKRAAFKRALSDYVRLAILTAPCVGLCGSSPAWPRLKRETVIVFPELFP